VWSEVIVGLKHLLGIKAEGRRASVMPEACFQHDPPPGTAIWLQPVQRSGVFRIRMGKVLPNSCWIAASRPANARLL
jgi:hypothetical protein